MDCYYFQGKTGLCGDINIFPAPSASEAGTLISVLRGLGTKFLVLLDDDKPGRDAAKKYREHHLLGEQQVFTLSDVNPSLAGKTFEALYTPEVHALASRNGDEPTKGQFSLLFQQLYAERNYTIGLGQTTNKIKALLVKLDARMKGVTPVLPAKKKKSLGKKSKLSLKTSQAK